MPEQKENTLYTVTVYTDYARPNEKRQILSLRLDKPKEKVTVGEVEFKR